MNNTSPEQVLLSVLETQVSIPAYAILIVVIILLFLICIIYCRCCWSAPPAPSPPTQLRAPLLHEERVHRILRSETRKPRFVVQGQAATI